MRLVKDAAADGEQIATGLRVGFGLSFGILIAAELIAADSGMGYLVMQSREPIAPDFQRSSRTIQSGCAWCASNESVTSSTLMVPSKSQRMIQSDMRSLAWEECPAHYPTSS